MLSLWVRSFQELKKLRTITGMALLLAISVIIDQFTLQLTPTLKVGFGFIVTGLSGMLYGPVCAGLMGGVGDVVRFIIKPTGTFFFGFTLNAILGGILYGLCFYKNKVTVWRCVISKTLANLIINILLNTLWLSILMGKGFYGLLVPRITKNLIALPIEILLLWVILGPLAKYLKAHPNVLE